MNLRRFGVLGALIVFVLVGASAIFYTSFRLGKHSEYLNDSLPDADKIEKASGESITLTETQQGKRKWIIKLKKIHYSKDNQTATLEGVQGLLYGDKPAEDGKQEVLAVFTSPTGQYDKQVNHFHLTDGVKMYSPSAKVTMLSPTMDWSSTNNLITAAGGVRMNKDGFGSSNAKKAVFKMDFSEIQFIGAANSTLGGHSDTGG